MITLTEKQKKDFILKQCKDEPIPDIKYTSPTVVYYNGSKGGKTYTNFYIPYMGVVYKGEIPDFAMEEIKETFQNATLLKITPSKAPSYMPYTRYFDKQECLEFSVISEDVSRFNRTIDSDKREPKFSFPNLIDGISWRKVKNPNSSYGFTWERHIDTFKNGKGQEIERLFLFSDSPNIYCETGERVFLDEEGKYYNKMFVKVLTRLLSKTRINYGKSFAGVENLNKFAALRGEDVYSYYDFAKVYKNMKDRNINKKPPQEFEAVNVTLKDVSSLINAHPETDGCYAYYEKVTDDVNVVRFFSKHASACGIREYSRYYITKTGIRMYTSYDYAMTTRFQFESYVVPHADGYGYGSSGKVKLCFLNIDAIANDAYIGKYFEKFLTINRVCNSCMPWRWFENNESFALISAFGCHRNSFAKNLYKAGYYNLASEYCCGRDNESFNFIFCNYTNSAVVTNRINFDEEGIKFIDKTFGEFSSKYKAYNLKEYFIHYLRYVYGMDETICYEKTFDKVAKVFSCVGMVHEDRSDFMKWFDVDARNYAWYHRKDENRFDSIAKTKSENMRIINNFSKLLEKDEDYIVLYLKTVANIRTINENISSSCYGAGGKKYMPETYGLSPDVGMTKLKEIYDRSYNDAINMYHIIASKLK